MSTYQTRFGSLKDFSKGKVELIDDNPKNYVFSNIFEVCSKSKPYERVAVAKNFEYVIEAMRAEGTSGWFSASHDEFVLCMDGKIEVHLVKLGSPQTAIDRRRRPVRARRCGRSQDGPADPEPRAYGAFAQGRRLPVSGGRAGRAMIQTIEGPLTVQKWSEICQIS